MLGVEYLHQKKQEYSTTNLLTTFFVVLCADIRVDDMILLGIEYLHQKKLEHSTTNLLTTFCVVVCAFVGVDDMILLGTEYLHEKARIFIASYSTTIH